MIGMGQQREGNEVREEAKGIWATSSCNLLLPSEPAQAQSHTYLFQLILEYSCTDSVLWLGRSDIQFVLGILGLGGMQLGIYFLLRSSNKPKAVFPKQSRYGQRKVGLCSKSLRVCTVIYLQRPDRGSKQHLYSATSPSSTMESAGSSTKQLEPVSEHSLVLAPLKTSSTLGHSVNGPEQLIHMKNMLLLKSSEAHQVLWLFFWLQEGQMQQLNFHLRKSMSTCSISLEPFEISLRQRALHRENR